ncbi:SH3 domain containing protein [Acanthamoeba castellanii str. Neff]|jgi:hypothetical protein|uniref:SH3 domain containing protein n=1 Tax=Acanthamoeba castellanii (strain ATCC 30010 / Neff) TaxID=1257118 RepID=L8HG50_ACACF|nr:SH3 domain containing protein [Acanthamoeba castellanii str. Neff]ELR23703.1 SH3 domain containing protein [Acanthamoeba castellanii str. Neff]
MENNKGVEFVVALYNYTSRKETELSYRKGDVLALLRPPDDSGWWYGRHATADSAAASGGGVVEGLFAHNYVKPIELQLYVGKHAFKGKGDDPAYLPFAQGDVLEVVLPDSSGWWLARRAGGSRLALVPANYIAVAPPKEEDKQALPQPQQTQQPTAAESAHTIDQGSTSDEEAQEQPAVVSVSAADASREAEVVQAAASSPAASATAVPGRTEEGQLLPASTELEAALAQLLPSLNAGAEASTDLVQFLRDQLQRREQFTAQLAGMLQAGDPSLTHSG